MKSLHLQGVWGSQTLYYSDNMMILLQIYNKKEPSKNPAAMATDMVTTPGTKKL